LKLKNLAGAILSKNDVKTGMKSAVKALGSNNPFTIQTAGEVSTTVAVQGGGGIYHVLISHVEELMQSFCSFFFPDHSSITKQNKYIHSLLSNYTKTQILCKKMLYVS
jgi:hypothetical protein